MSTDVLLGAEVAKAALAAIDKQETEVTARFKLKRGRAFFEYEATLVVKQISDGE